MGKVFSIYTQQQSPVSLDELQGQMNERGIPVEWRPTLLSERGEKLNWTMGSFYPKGKQARQVSTVTEALSPATVDEKLDLYGASLPETKRKALASARRKYQLEGEVEDESILINLIDLIASLSRGLIHQTESSDFHSLSEFRRQHSSVLKRPSE